MGIATQIGVVSAIATVMTVGVYGFVAGIIKLDDAGLYLSALPGETVFAKFKRWFGALLLAFAPYLMKALTIVGTAAMFLVGGGILTHGLPLGSELVHDAEALVASIPSVGAALATIMGMLVNGLCGVIAGAIAMPIVNVVTKLLPRRDTGD